MRRVAILILFLAFPSLWAEDQPRKQAPNIEVTIYLMSALNQPSTVNFPAELEGVMKQLKSMFSYKGYQLIDTQLIRVRAGEVALASAVINNKTGTDGKTISQIKFRASAQSDEKGRVIHIDALKVGLKLPVPMGAQFQYVDTGISTDVDVREGQKVVVGKANMDGSDRASIVVLTAKVVD